ncbi:FecR domain-containing protein [Sphingomonadaceae bacterium jetA1]|uniref:FecR family protein n=1 Tax=Facivitalis istanbulensis TaxID=3075838 RepID=UPI00349AC914
MTSSSQSGLDTGHDPVLRAAIQWRMRLDEKPDDAVLRRDIEHWIAEGPANAAAWTHAGHVLGLIGQAKSVSFLPTPQENSGGWSRSARKDLTKRLAMVAAMAALLAVLTPPIMVRMRADYVTGLGEQRLLALEDGSTVRLAPGSAIGVGYRSDRRSVRLLSGEAYFEVRRDTARPFEVIAQGTKVTVLGTGFDVRLGRETTEVAVKHGRVRVDYADGRQPVSDVLEPGQWARIAWNGGATRGFSTTALVGSWSGDRLIAVNRPLSDVIADVRRYYHGAIILSDRGLGQRIVTGSYDMRDPAKAVATIVGPLGATVTRITPWLVIVSAP